MFKHLYLQVLSALEKIITSSYLAFISIRSTFNYECYYYDFSTLAKLIADSMIKVLRNIMIQELHSPSPCLCMCLYLHEDPITLDNFMSMTPAEKLIFNVLNYNDRFADLHVCNFIRTFLDVIKNGLCGVTICVNANANTFILFFLTVISNLLSNLQSKLALSLWKLRVNETRRIKEGS